MPSLTVYRGGQVFSEVALQRAEAAIGRKDGNQVVLPDDGNGVSRVHAILRFENGAYVLTDQSQNGTLIDGKRIKSAILRDGQEFVIGPYRLVFNVAEALSAAVPEITMTSAEPLVAVAPESPAQGTASGTQTESTAKPSQTGLAAKTGGTAATRRSGLIDIKSIDARAWVSRQPRSVLYGIGGGVVALLAVVTTWLMWPASEPVLVVQTTTTTTTTTSVPGPPPNPDAERLQAATDRMKVVDEQLVPAQRGKQIRADQYAAAAAALDLIIVELLQPILDGNANHEEALGLQKQISERATQLRALAKPQVTVTNKALTTIPIFDDPEGVVRGTAENDTAYNTRNTRAKADYDRGRALLEKQDWLAALNVWTELGQREPEFRRDVAAQRKLAQEELDRARESRVADGMRRDEAGHKAYTAGRFEEAAKEQIGARNAFEQAIKLLAPEAAKLLEGNLERRRFTGKALLDRARIHANAKSTSEARRLFNLVVELLPAGESSRTEAETDLKKLGGSGMVE